jgi:hypothetical protein
MREAAANLNVSSGVGSKSACERRCARQLLILTCLVV